MTEPVSPIVCLMGPTASGKTDLAVSLVEALPMEIISVDSALVYKGMDIGTAKPGPDVLQRAPHRLIDFLDPADAYSAARFCEDAMSEMAAVIQAGRIPLLVGGTMMYFRSLLQGMADLPSADESVRQALAAEAVEHGWQAMHRQLAQVDPISAQRIHPNDPQRISRALEVFRLTGTPLSQWLQRSASALPFRPLLLGLAPSNRKVLHERIAQRFEGMLQDGLIAEVETLYQRGDLSLDTPAIRSVGYRQVWQYLRGELDYADMRDKAVAATRQLAKRQLTWMRSMPGLINIDCLNKGLDEEVLKILHEIHIN